MPKAPAAARLVVSADEMAPDVEPSAAFGLEPAPRRVGVGHGLDRGEGLGSNQEHRAARL
jgi:hypothetical protein